MAHMGRPGQKGVRYSGFREGISYVEVYERVAKFLIELFKRVLY